MSRFLTESLQRTPGSQLTVNEVTSRGWDALLHLAFRPSVADACVLLAGLAAQWFQVGWRFQIATCCPMHRVSAHFADSANFGVSKTSLKRASRS